jgi:hypothetical protein
VRSLHVHRGPSPPSMARSTCSRARQQGARIGRERATLRPLRSVDV